MLLTDPFPKTLSEDFGSTSILAMSSLETLYMAELLPFSGSFIAMMLAYASMSVHFSRSTSPTLPAVSLAVWRATLSFLLLPEIN
jgi:hypothetical protein